jgi:transposase
MSDRLPSRRELLDVIERQGAEITRLAGEVTRLHDRVAELEAERTILVGEEKGRPPAWGKPNAAVRASTKKARRKRSQNFARKRSPEPTQQIVHGVARCPRCDCALLGGWVKRHREIIELPVAQVEVIDHVLLERTCAMCGTGYVPALGGADGVVGQHRLGPRLMAYIATLHEEGRMPIDVIQNHLATIWRLALSSGAIEGVLQAVAKRGQSTVATIQEEIRHSPIVHADETSWREDGQNRYVWLIATPTARLLEIGRRTNAHIDDLLGQDFAGTLVTDFYGAYDHFLGEKQRCWAHLWRDVRDLLTQFPTDRVLVRWANQLRRLYHAARDQPGLLPSERTQRRLRLEELARRLAEPFVGTDAPQRTLCQRVLKYSHELFTFVENRLVPPTNNLAERTLRPYVIARKVWGGTRSEQGSIDAMRRASLVLTWRARGRNPFVEFQNLLLSPQV